MIWMPHVDNLPTDCNLLKTESLLLVFSSKFEEIFHNKSFLQNNCKVYRPIGITAK